MKGNAQRVDIDGSKESNGLSYRSIEQENKKEIRCHMGGEYSVIASRVIPHTVID